MSDAFTEAESVGVGRDVLGMGEFDRSVLDVAAGQRFLITRMQVFDLGGSKHHIESRIRHGSWQRVHPGVYQVDCRPLDWESRLLAAVLASGPHAWHHIGPPSSSGGSTVLAQPRWN